MIDLSGLGVPENSGEQWLSMAPLGYPRYRMSNYGRVIRDNETLCAISINQRGHRFYPLRDPKGKLHQLSAGKLVASLFLPEEEDHIMQSVIHKDGNRHNLFVGNLAWRPRWYAARFHKELTTYQWIKGEGAVEDLGTGILFSDVRKVAKQYGVLISDVRLHLNGLKPSIPFTHHRFSWQITGPRMNHVI